MCTSWPIPQVQTFPPLEKRSTKINRLFTGFTVKVSNVLSQGWDRRSKAGDVSMTKEVWVSYIKHLLPPLDPLIAHDCKQGNAKNLKKDESDPPLYEDHQSPAVSSLFISSSKAALFHFMDIMKAKMDSAGKAVWTNGMDLLTIIDQGMCECDLKVANKVWMLLCLHLSLTVFNRNDTNMNIILICMHIV